MAIEGYEHRIYLKHSDFLRFNERPVLIGAGPVAREVADRSAHDAREDFSARRREALEGEGELCSITSIAVRLGLRVDSPMWLLHFSGNVRHCDD